MKLTTLSMVISRITHSHDVSEALHDITKYFDEKMINYMNDNLNDPSRRAGYLRAVKHYQKLAANTKDPRDALYFEYRAYLPETQAWILAREFYQREIRSGTGSDVAIGEEGEEYSIVDSIGYGNVFAGKGMFNSLGVDMSPQKHYEIDDLLSKLFNSRYFEAADRIVLVVYLMLGTGPGMRAKANSDRSGLDLETLMDNPPKELFIVEDQIEKLLKFGIEPDAITGEKILQGANKNDAENGTVKVSPLVGTNRVQVAKANISKAMIELMGTDDMSQIKNVLLSESKNPSEIMTTMHSYLAGDSVEVGKLISLIVFAVNSNIKHKTRLSKSKRFTGSVKSIASSYLELAKSKTEEGVMLVQNMIMAPVLDAADPRLNK